MAFVLIWQLDDEVVRRLEQRAAGNNRPLKQGGPHFGTSRRGKYGGKETRFSGIVQEVARPAEVAIVAATAVMGPVRS